MVMYYTNLCEFVRLSVCCRELYRIGKLRGVEINGDFEPQSWLDLHRYLSMPITCLRIPFNLSDAVHCHMLDKLVTHSSIRSVSLTGIDLNGIIGCLNKSRVRELELVGIASPQWYTITSLPLLTKLTVIYKHPTIPAGNRYVEVHHQGLRTLVIGSRPNHYSKRKWIIPIHRFSLPSLTVLRVTGGIRLPCIHLVMECLPPTLTTLDMDSCDMCDEKQCATAEPKMKLESMSMMVDRRHPSCRSIMHAIIQYAGRFQQTLTQFTLGTFIYGTLLENTDNMLWFHKDCDMYKSLQALPTTLTKLSLQLLADHDTLECLPDILKPLVHLELMTLNIHQIAVEFYYHHWVRELFSSIPPSCLVSFIGINKHSELHDMTETFAFEWKWDRTIEFIAPQTRVTYESWKRYIVNKQTNITEFVCFDIDWAHQRDFMPNGDIIWKPVVKYLEEYQQFLSRNKQLNGFRIVGRMFDMISD
jgi:hypothetical protein